MKLVISNGILKSYKEVDEVVRIPEGVKVIATSAFENCNEIKKVILPESLMYICSSAFYNCKNLESVIGGEQIKYFTYKAFAGCSKLKNIKIPSNIDKTALISQEELAAIVNREKNTFKKCSENVKNLKLNDDIEYIAEYAMDDCNSILSVYFGKKFRGACDEDGNTIELSSVFEFCDAIESITVSKDNPYFVCEDGILYSKDKRKLILCPVDKTEVNINDNTECAEKYSFANCQSIKKLKIGNNFIYKTADTNILSLNIEVQENIEVSADNPYYSDDDGILYNKDKNILIKCPSSRETLIIPDYVKELAWHSVGIYTKAILNDHLLSKFPFEVINETITLNFKTDFTIHLISKKNLNGATGKVPVCIKRDVNNQFNSMAVGVYLCGEKEKIIGFPSLRISNVICHLMDRDYLKFSDGYYDIDNNKLNVLVTYKMNGINQDVINMFLVKKFCDVIFSDNNLYINISIIENLSEYDKTGRISLDKIFLHNNVVSHAIMETTHRKKLSLITIFDQYENRYEMVSNGYYKFEIIIENDDIKVNEKSQLTYDEKSLALELINQYRKAHNLPLIKMKLKGDI